MKRRDHYELQRITRNLGQGFEGNPYMRAYRAGYSSLRMAGFRSYSLWTIELGAPIGGTK